MWCPRCSISSTFRSFRGHFRSHMKAHIWSHINWPHLNPIFLYFFIGFLTIIYKKPYKKQWFLIQFDKLDRFPGSTKIFSKNVVGHFRPFFAIILFFDLSISNFDLKTSIFIQRQILEARFSHPNSTFSSRLPPPTFSNFVVFRTFVTQFKWGQFSIFMFFRDLRVPPNSSDVQVLEMIMFLENALFSGISRFPLSGLI